jgi:hypothetical protein
VADKEIEMTLTGWPTDAGDGSVANEARWRKMARLFTPSGVVGGYLQEMVPTMGTGQINVAAGAVWIDGHYAELGTATSVAQSGDGMLVARFTSATNVFELVWRGGILYNQLTQTDAVFEIPIARVAAAAFTDYRSLVGSRGTSATQRDPTAAGFTGATGRWTRSSPNQSIPNNAWTRLATLVPTGIGHTSDYGLWTMITASNILQVNRGGVLDITAGVGWDFNTTGQRGIRVLINGLVYAGSVVSSAGQGTPMQTATTGPLKVLAGDAITAEVFQNSGSALNADVTNVQPFIAVTRVG